MSLTMTNVNRRNNTLKTLINKPAGPRLKLHGSNGSPRTRFSAIQPMEMEDEDKRAPTPRLVRILNAFLLLDIKLI